MKKSHLIAFSCILMLAVSGALSEAAANEDGVADVKAEQKSRLYEIDNHVAEQNQLIERSFIVMSAGVQERRSEYLAHFATLLGHYTRPEALMLRGLMEVYGGLTRVDRQVTSDRFFSQSAIGISPQKMIAGDILYAAESHIWSPTSMDNVAARLVTDMEAFEAELLQLQRRREIAIEQLARWQNHRRSQVLGAGQTAGPSQVNAAGAEIIAISYGDGKASAMIGERIVYEGQLLEGARVVRIAGDKVQFSRNGLTWTRQLGQKAF
jgi:hypothetical protein